MEWIMGKQDTKKTDNISDRLFEVVNYFICRSNETNGRQPLTNKKLQKLLYYAQAWNLVFNKEKLFEEDIEAWIHGPVIPVIYHRYKEYGRLPIRETRQFDESKFAKEELAVLNDVWKTYGKFDGNYLEVLSHSEDPWIIARGRAEADESCTTVIDPIIMQAYYTEKNR